jgi:hypothetical protein
MKRLWLILFVIPLFAQNETLAIIDFEANGVSKSESKNIVSKIESELIKLSCMQLVERSKIEEVLIEQGFQQSGCTTTECAVEIGKLLGTDKLLLGSVGKIGRIYTINAKIVSVESGEILTGHEVIAEGGIEELYITKSVELAYKICGLNYPKKTIPKTTAPPPARKSAPPTPRYIPPKIIKPKEKNTFFTFSASYYTGSKSVYKTFDEASVVGSDNISRRNLAYYEKHLHESKRPIGFSMSLGVYKNDSKRSIHDFRIYNITYSTKRYSYRGLIGPDLKVEDIVFRLEFGKNIFNKFSVSYGYMLSGKSKANLVGSYFDTYTDEEGFYQFSDDVKRDIDGDGDQLFMFDGKATHAGLIAINYHFYKLIIKLEYVHDFTEDFKFDNNYNKHRGLNINLVVPFNGKLK